MSEQEKAWWEWWNQIENHLHLYNLRMAFDEGYARSEGRIIKLLESFCDCKQELWEDGFMVCGMCYAVELITGETE